MSLTPPTMPPPLKKIWIHSLLLHAWLPQMLPLVQYTRRSPPLLHSTESGTKTSLTQMSPLPANSMTQTKKTSHHQHLLLPVLVPQFKPKHSEEPKHASHFPTMSPSTELSSLLLQEYETTSTVAARTSSKLKRSSELARLSSTAGPPAMTKKPRYLLPSWTTSEGWSLEQRQIPLHHHHPLTSPF